MKNGRPKIFESVELKEHIGKINEFSELDEGLNSVYRVRSNDGEFIVKECTNDRNDIEWFRAEPLIYERLESLEIPSPEVIYTDLYPEEGNEFFVMTKMEGVNPSGFKKDIDFDVLKGILREFGRILGVIHSNTEMDGYGMLGGFEGSINNTDEAEKWIWHLQGAVEEMEDLIEDGWDKAPELDYPSEERIAELLPESPQAVLLHLDNRLDNLLIDDNQVTAFLDWSHPEAGHHEYDIVRAEYLLIDYDLGFLDEERKKDLREALYEAYEGEMKIEKEDFEKRKNLYRKITVIWIMAGFPNWGAEFEPDKKKSFRKKLVERARKEGL